MTDAACPHCRKTLPASQFFGTVAFSRGIEGFRLAEVRHSCARDVPRHAHSSAFVSVLLKGRYQSRFGSTAVDFEPGRAVWHEGGFDHEDAIAEGGALFFCVEVEGRAVGQLEGYCPKPQQSRALDARASAALLSLFVANRREDDGLGCESLCAEFLGLMCLPEAANGEDCAPWIGQVCQRLCDDPGKRATLAELAALAGVHPSHLTRGFRARFGTSVGEFARAQRLARSWQMLADRRMPIAEVAYALGYADQAHFTREFSAQMGMPPATMRRTLHA